MKKMIFAVLVVLLAMLAVACDSAVFPATGADLSQAAPPPEPGMVTINIKVDDSRARGIDAARGKAATTFYEVVFVVADTPTNKIVRSSTTATAGNVGGTWSVTVPIANYADTGNSAVLFGGVNTAFTLLGIGVIDSTTTSGSTVPNSSDITSNTTGVTFKVTAIGTNVGPVTGGNGTSTSSFRITAPVGTSPNAADDFKDRNTTSSADHSGIPVFEVPANSAAITATWTLTNANFGKAKLETISGSWVTVAPENSTTLSSTGVTPTISTAPSTSDITPGTSIVVAFGITTPTITGPGLTKLTLSVPIYAHDNVNANYNGTTTAAIQWKLSGGSAPSTFDDGTNATTNTGGAVLLKVITPDPVGGKTIGVTVDGTWGG